MARKHALLSASSAERWLNCPPSARLCEGMKAESSVYAEEGTLAHHIAELMLKRDFGLIGHDFEEKLDSLKNHELYYDGMLDEVEAYTAYVLETCREAKTRTPDAITLIEQQLDFSKYVPDGFGTGDCIIIADGEMELIDLKFGKGVEVSPVRNPQLMLYALGAYEKFSWLYDMSHITMTIAQVRLGNISSWTITVPMLLEWAKSIKPVAQLAYEGKGEFTPGHWCTFCQAKAVCKARAKTNVNLYHQHQQDPNLLTIDEIAEILGMAADIEAWAKEFQAYALEQALQGVRFPGWKLVEGRSIRKIEDEGALAQRLIEEGYDETQIYKPRQLEGITGLERLVGKKRFAELTDGLIAKPPGKPTLVPEADKRPELDSAENDFF